ncbi:MAG: hypothetical protein HC914_09680 [Chloroflexaceae bacterium]|nr:hypothetical protein [Chloroflexaceae bacterium]
MKQHWKRIVLAAALGAALIASCGPGPEPTPSPPPAALHRVGTPTRTRSRLLGHTAHPLRRRRSHRGMCHQKNAKRQPYTPTFIH